MEGLAVMVPHATHRRFWSGKRVTITGHSGFKGSWLSLWLHSLGAHVQGISLPPHTRPSLFEVARVSDVIASDFIDIRDPKKVKDSIHRFSPDIVIHMAAQPLVRASYKMPVETYATNVMGTLHVLDAVRTCGSTKTVLVITTDKCYKNLEWSWGYREVDHLGGYDPYSNSKACAELLCESFRDSFFTASGVTLATARAGNVIGGGDWSEDRLIPDLFRAFEQEVPATIRFPSAVRPWQHVLEPLGGYLRLVERLHSTEGKTYTGAWNFGPRDSDARSVGWVADEICRLWGGGCRWVHEHGSHAHEARLLKLDISKAQSQLDWTPKWNLLEALKLVVDWHKAWRVRENMQSYTLRQIATYESAYDNNHSSITS